MKDLILVVLSNAKDLGVCFGPERSCSVILSESEESRTCFSSQKTHPRSFGRWNNPQDDNPPVVLSSAKDLVLIVILNGVKNLVLLLKGPHPRFFRPEAFRMTHPDPSSTADPQDDSNI